MALVLVTGPASEPVSVEEAKAHLRVDGSDDDAYIGTLITTARSHVETITRRALITQTWKLVLDDWPDDVLELYLPPLVSVSSLTYKDADGDTQTFASSNYVVDADSVPGRLCLADDASWPSDDLYPMGAVQIQYVAGYGDADEVPQPIKSAILLLVGHYYENREAALVAQGANVQELPIGIEALLSSYRVWTF